MLVATAGHVDHGKTALIKALTNVDTDRLAEEKKRGLTIDLGFAYQSMGSAGTIGFIDVPGHEKFLSNMLSGVAGIDLAMLVIAADDGPMPQTVEHLSILDLLGIKQGIIVISKVDRVSEERLTEVRAEIDILIETTFFSSSPVFFVSSLQNTGISSLSSYLNKCAEKLSRPDPEQQRFRLAIDRWFQKSGHGLIVTGTVFSGSATVGDQLTLSSSGREDKEQSVRVRGIHANGGESARALAGQRCALNISGRGVELSNFARGDWLLCSQHGSPGRQLDARLTILASEKHPFTHWSPVHIYIGAAHITGRVVILQNQPNTEQSPSAQPVIEPAGNGLVRLILDTPLYAIAGDRFIIRDQSSQRTIGGGTVIDTYGPKRGRAGTKRLQSLRIMENANRENDDRENDDREINSKENAIQSLLEQAPGGIDLIPLFNTWNLSVIETNRVIDKIDAFLVANTAFSIQHWHSLTKTIISFVTGWTIDNPECQGIAPELLWQQLNLPISWSTLVKVANKLIEQKQLVRCGHLLHNPGHLAQISNEDQAFWRIVRPCLEDDIPCPPVVHDLAAALELEVDDLRGRLERLTHLGWLIKVGANRYFTAKSLGKLAGLVTTLAQSLLNEESSGDEFDRNEVLEPGLFSPAQFRDISGIGRRPCIDILEFFDSCGLTQRIGNTRKVVQSSTVIFPEQEMSTKRNL